MWARLKAMPPAYSNPVYRLVMLIAGLLMVAASIISLQSRIILLFVGCCWCVISLSDYARSYSLTLAALLRLSATILAIIVVILALYSLFLVQT
jgi:hypothetical protein